MLSGGFVLIIPLMIEHNMFVYYLFIDIWFSFQIEQQQYKRMYDEMT